MFHVKLSLFSQTKALELKIDNFHDKIIDAAMMFKKGIRVYLSEGRSEEFKKINLDTIDLVLLDINLPDINGIKLFEFSAQTGEGADSIINTIKNYVDEYLTEYEGE